MRPPVNRNLNQRIRQALYQLKKDYGADRHLQAGLQRDGRKDGREDHHQDGDACAEGDRRALADGSGRQSDDFTHLGEQAVRHGGHYDVNQRDFIIDRRDVPALPELTADDWIVYNRRKYQVKTVESFEVDAGWVVTARELVGEDARVHPRPAG